MKTTREHVLTGPPCDDLMLSLAADCSDFPIIVKLPVGYEYFYMNKWLMSSCLSIFEENR